MASDLDSDEDDAVGCDCCYLKGKRVTCDLRCGAGADAYDQVSDEDDLDHGAFCDTRYKLNDERMLWSDQIAKRGETLEYFLRDGRRDECEFDKESLFTASMALPMIAWSSGQYWGPRVGWCRCSCDWNCTDFHIAGWLMRGLLFACLWLQWWLLDALHAARVKFPALDGVPYLCTYGQDTGNGTEPRGPNGIVFEKNRGNIESNYFNVMMRNGLANALGALNMTNVDIGPVDYGMESASCRLACVTILCMWVVKTLLLETRMLRFMVGVPKLLFNPVDGFSEHYHFWEHCCPCKGDDWPWYFVCYQWCNIWLPPAIYIACFPFLLYSLVMSITNNVNMMHEAMLKLLGYWLVTTFVMHGFFAIRAPQARYSWIRAEEETEDYIRSWENAVFHVAQVEDNYGQTDKAWPALRTHMKNDLWALLGRRHFAKVKFDPNSLPYHYYWCEVLPFFTLRVFVMLMVARQGILVLLNTGSIMDLILNSLAITFVLELEKLLFHLFSQSHVKDVMSCLQPFKSILVADCVLSCYPSPAKEQDETKEDDLFLAPDEVEENEGTDARTRCAHVLACFHLREGTWQQERSLTRTAKVPNFRKGDILKRSDDYKRGKYCCYWTDYVKQMADDHGDRKWLDWEEVSGQGAMVEKVEADFQTVWTIEKIKVQQAADKVSGILCRRGNSDVPKDYKLSFTDVPVAKFAKAYKLEMRDGWALLDETSGEGPIVRDRRCCIVFTRFCSYMVPLFLFGMVVYGVHLFYFLSHCDLELWKFKDWCAPYFDGDIRLLGGWMAVLGSWISKNVTYDNETYCIPYRGTDMVDPRNASLCAITEVPTKLPWQ